MASNFIISDLDDTFCKAYGEPTKRVCEAWNKFSSDPNYCLIIATGQQYTKVKSFFLANHLALPAYIIADQGTVIFDTAKNEILDTFWLPSEDVNKVYSRFIENGGKNEFVRIYNPELVFAYECDIARSFFKATNQRNVVFGKKINHIMAKGRYTKVIMMAEPEKVDELVLYSNHSNTLLSVNTGTTKYGECGFSRFEIVASNKQLAIEALLKKICQYPDMPDNIRIIGLGDEFSDYGIAQAALGMNLYEGCSGKFFVIGSGTAGNIKLQDAVTNLSISIGFTDAVSTVPSVLDDGWAEAIEGLISENN